MRGFSKIALDALKARAMAKKVGLEPELGSAWKWALRNMRNMHTGEPLQGEELEQAKLELGKMPDDVREILDQQSKLHGKEKEIGLTMTANEPNIANIFVGDEGSVQMAIPDPTKDSLIRDVHTHPYANDAEKMLNSIFSQISDHHFIMGRKRARNLQDETKQLLFNSHQEHGRLIGTKPSMVSPSGYGNRTPDRISEYKKEGGGDYGSFLRESKLHPKTKFGIYNPEFGFESTHRVRGDDLRSVYWSGNPEEIAKAEPVMGYKTPEEFINESMQKLYPPEQSHHPLWPYVLGGGLGIAGLMGYKAHKKNQEKAAAEDFITIDKGYNDTKYAEKLKRLREHRNPPTLLLPSDASIAKEASAYSDALERIHRHIQNEMQQHEVDALLTKLKESYQIDTPFRHTNAPELTKAFVPDEKYPRGLVVAPHVTDLMLHEFGHAKDFLAHPKLSKFLGKFPSEMEQLPGFMIAAAAPPMLINRNDHNAVTNTAIGLGVGTSLGGAASWGLGKAIEGAEDRANSFVKKVWADELGSAGAAQQRFDASELPWGRRTYSAATHARFKRGLYGGTMGGMIGIPLAIRAAKKKREATDTSIAKHAASFDARRNKQYWQLLKRLYGGNDEAVSAIKETRDPGIYHGTRASKVDEITMNGLKPGGFREFGKGTFFGDKQTAGYYNKPVVTDRMFGTQRDSILHFLEDGSPQEIKEPSEMVAFAQQHPEHYEIGDSGGLFRLNLPSELRGSKVLYPDVKKAKVFDVQTPNALEKVAPRHIHSLQEHSPLFTRYDQLVERQIGQMDPDQLRDLGRRFNPNTKSDSDWSSLQAKRWLQQQIVEQRVKDYATVNTSAQQHQLRTYGKLGGRRVFEQAHPDGHRYEMFFDHTDIPPELIRQAAQVFLGLDKEAASFDARRNKQYWQLLKRLYGGNDEAIAAIKQTGDPGIYHGTKTQNMPDVLQNGLVFEGKENSGRDGMNNEFFDDFGKGGIFFGDKAVARKYTTFKDGKYVGEEGMVRLPFPSELQGTETLYPNVSTAQKTALVGNSRTLRVGDDVYVQSFPSRLTERALQAYRGMPKGKEYIKSRSAELVGHADKDRIIAKELHNLANPFANPDNANKVRYYGRAEQGGPSVTDWDGNQFHFVADHLSPELIRQAAQTFLGIEKEAASFDARRSKQYWQLLKRLHGGNDEAVSAIKETRDPGIYHGTTVTRANKILESGLQAGGFREFGTGTFFGDRKTAEGYMGDLFDEQPDFRGMIRLKPPSELKGTKLLYPDVQKAKVFDVQTPDALEKVAPHPVWNLKAYSPLFERYDKLVERHIGQMDLDQLHDLGRRFQPDATAGPEWASPQAKRWLKQQVIDQRVKDYISVNTPKEQHQLQTYGKLSNGKRFFKVNSPETTRKEMFFDHTDIPPDLIRQAAQAVLGVEKEAASFDARRNKQYWQLLTRLHGGKDEAIEAIKETRDPGIYHGTKEENIPSILENGMDGAITSDYGKVFGNGSYFGTKEVVKNYGDGGAIRLALPSELRGTKLLYPDPTSAMKFTNEMHAVNRIHGNLHHLGEEMGMSRQENEDKRLLHVVFNQPWHEEKGPMPKTPERYKLQYYGKSDHYDPTIIGYKTPLIQNMDQNDFMVVNQDHIPSHLIRQAAKTFLGIEKSATLNADVQLHPHQQHFVDKPGNAVIAAHPVGSGKTLSGIARFEHLRDQHQANHALVVVPSSLRNNFGQEGVAKFTNSRYNVIGNQQERQKGLAHDVDPNADYNIVSYDLFRRQPQRYLDDAHADTLILDEMHRGKNEGTLTTDSLKGAKGHYQNLIGLTGSVVSNSLSDVQPLMEIAGNTELGASKGEFADRFFRRDNSPKYRDVKEARRPIVGFYHRNLLQKELGKVVDYVDPDDIKDLARMPNKDVNVIKVPLSREQAHFYRGLLNKDPKIKKMIVAKRYETLRDDEVAQSYNKLMEARKLMNSFGSVKPGISLSESAARTPKVEQLMSDLENHLEHTPDGQALLFSHLINGGVDVMEEGLKAHHIPYGKFIGKGNEGITEEGRQQDVTDYNAGKKRVLIVSPAGGEGLSLNNTTWEGVLDPHYNPEKMNQMEARGVRSGGLAHRPEAERNVKINRYLATMPKRFGIFKSKLETPDEFIYDISRTKDQQNELLRRLLYEGKAREQLEVSKGK